MKTADLPEMILLKQGESLKILQINGRARIKMPLHHSTQEAVVIVSKGKAILNIDKKKHLLQEGNMLIIPAKQDHTLSVKTRFKALINLSNDSKIEFIKESTVNLNN